MTSTELVSINADASKLPDVMFRRLLVVVIALMCLGVGNVVSASEASAVPRGESLYSGQYLIRGDYMTSANGRYRLSFQGDGNLVLYNTKSWRACWNTATQGKGGTRFWVQHDSNMVMYTAAGSVLWHSNTAGKTGLARQLIVHCDGNLVLYRYPFGPAPYPNIPGPPQAIWHSNTVGC